MTPLPQNISTVDIIAGRAAAAAFAHRPWDKAMLRFLKVQRRRGRPMRWIAGRLGVDLLRAVAMAVNLGLVLPATYRRRRCAGAIADEPPPLGPAGEIAEPGLCRWIAADPTGPWAMCARPAVQGWPYCAHHKARAYAVRKPLHPSEVMRWRGSKKEHHEDLEGPRRCTKRHAP